MKRYQYNQIAKAEPTVVHYKLYKAKKQWVVQGMTTVALLLGVHEAQVHGVPGLVAPDVPTAKADTLGGQDQPASPETATAQTDQSVSQDQTVASTPTATVAPTTTNDPATVVNDQSANQPTATTTDTSIVTPTATVETTPTTTTDQATGTVTATSTQAGSDQTTSQTTQDQTGQNQISQAQATPTATTTTSTAKAATTKSVAQKAVTVKVKGKADFNRQAKKATKQAQKIANQVNQVVKADAKRANAKSTDKIVHNSGLDALSAHVTQELNQVKTALNQSTKQSQKLAVLQANLTQANELVASMQTELKVANKMLIEDKRGVNARFVSNSRAALNELVLPANTIAKVDEYGDLVVSTNSHSGYQTVLNQLGSKGLTKAFRNVVDPTQLYYGIKGYSDAELLAQAKLNVNSALSKEKLDISQDASTIKDTPFYAAPNITYYNSLLPYWTQLQTAYKSGSASDVMLSAAEFFGAIQAVGDYTTANGLKANSDQVQSSDSTSFALIMNVDENNNPIFTENTGRGGVIKAGDLLNHLGLVVDPTDPATDNGTSVNNFMSPSGLSSSTYFVGKIGDEIANPTIKETVPNFTYTGKTDTTAGNKLVSVVGGKTLQVVVNHWTSSVTPEVTAIKAAVGNVTKAEDGTATFKDVPSVTLSGKSDLTTPTFTADDFDWSAVKATPGTYAVTLNATGIKKITDANANTTLATGDVQAGQATITSKTPAVVAIKATVGDVTKPEDGSTTFKDVPSVTLSGKSDLTTPTFTADDFDWSAVKATPGTYAVTLNATGIKKITDANANTTLAVGDVQAGQATITSKTPTTQAIKATIGDVTKTEDGNAKFTEVPTVTVSDQAGHTLTTPDLAITDFDWSAVQAVPGTYDITLNATGINKILAANVNTTLATTDIAAGHAIITAKTPTTQAIKATIGNLTKDYDGTITFKDVPIVTVSDQAGHTLTTPTTLTKDDFDWSNVKADASTYDVTLTAAGIKKITDANANTTLATSDITAGQAIINKAAITITATNAGKTQGQADPALTATVIGKPTAGSDVKYTVSRDKGETPATYDINVTANATDNPNYTITTKKGVFTIVPADSITATVGNVDKTYDGKAFDTTVVPTVTLSGFATVVTPNFTHDDFDWSKVGTDAGSYSVTLTAAGLKKIVDANKGVTAVASAGNAVIKQADVTITANNATKVAGQADPTLTAKVSVQPAAGAKLVYTVSRAAGETVGTYPITVTATAAANPNYHITVVGGQFTITKSTATFDWTADYVDSVGNKLADPESGTDLHAGDHYTTTAKYIDGYYLTAEPADAAGTIKDGNVTVKYVYNKVGGFTITTPNGQVTTIAYAVDHTDPTKVSVPLNQTVPYVSGYDAVSPAGKLTLVDPADPTKGYKLPAMTTPDANTAITYVAVNNGGGGTNGNGTITPSNNAGTTTNSTNQTTGNETTPSLAGGNDHGGSQATKKQPSKPAKKAGKRTAQKTSTTKQAANTGNRRATTGQAVASNHGKQPSGQSGATSQATSTKSVAKTNQAHKQLANEPIEKAATLPQTGDSQSSAVVTWLGAVLVGFLGLFGLKRKRRF